MIPVLPSSTRDAPARRVVNVAGDGAAILRTDDYSTVPPKEASRFATARSDSRLNDRAPFCNNRCRLGCRLSHASSNRYHNSPHRFPASGMLLAARSVVTASYLKRGDVETVNGFPSCPFLCVLSVSAFPTIKSPGCMSGTLYPEARKRSRPHRCGTAPHDCTHSFSRYRFRSTRHPE